MLRAARAFTTPHDSRRGALARIAAIAALLLVGITAFGPAAQAFEVPTAPATVAGGVGTMTMPGSGLTTNISAAGLTSAAGATTLGSRGFVAGDYAQGLASSTPAVNVVTQAINNCPSVGNCTGLGTVTINFSQPARNPVLNIAGIGGEVHIIDATNGLTNMSQLHAVLTLATPGVTLTDLSGGNLAVSGSSITANNDSASLRCDTAAQSDAATGQALPSAQTTAACGSVRLNGVISSVTFNVSAVFTQTTASVPAYTNNNAADPLRNADGYSLSVTVPQDFGDAPASYDQGNAARADLSDLTLGSTVTEDNATVANGLSSPNASASATADAGDNGATFGPLAAGMTSYSTTVAISGASKAGTVCGWIDFNANGVFDNPTERACTTFAAGATSATLSWSGLSVLSAGSSYARLRIGYNAAQTQSPVGASDAGEVEDYPLTISASPLTCAPGTLYALNQTGSHELLALNTASGQTQVMTSFGAAIPNTFLNALAVVTGGSAAFATQQQYTVVGAQNLVNVYKYDAAAGTVQTVGAIAVAADDLNVVMGGIDPTTGLYWIGAYNETLDTFDFYAFNTSTNTSLGLQFRTPFPQSSIHNGDLAFDSTGRMYAVMSAGDGNPANNQLVVFEPPLISSGATVTGQLITNPQPYDIAVNGVAFGADGFLYTEANSGPGFAREIRKIDPATGAVVATVALLNPDGTANIDAADLGSCASPNTLSLQKNIVGRAKAADQFGLTIGGNGVAANNTGVTSGSSTGPQTTPAAVAGPVLAIPGRTYTIAEQGTSGATLGDYRSTYQCVDTMNGNAVVASGTGTSATVTMPAPSPSGSNVVCTFSNTPLQPALTLVKTATVSTDSNNDGKAGVGDVISFAFRVTNSGDVTLHGLAVADQLVAPAGPAVSVTCPATTLAPGATTTCTSTGYTVTQADVDAGSVANTATSTGLTPGGTPVTSTPSSTTTPTPSAGTLTLVKTAALTTDTNNDGKAGVGDVITYAFRVTNTGDVTLHALAITDQLVAPAGPAVTITCPATTLAPGASITCTATGYTVTQADVDAGSVANTATATGLTPGGTPVTSTPSSTTTPTPTAGTLVLVKTATLSTDTNNDGKAGVGDVISFAFRVTNTGDVTLHGLAITDQLVAPAGPAVSVTCPATTLAPAASITCTASSYTVTQADVDAGSVANTATATGTTPGGTPVTSTPSSTTTPTPSAGTLTLVKTATLSTDTNQDGKAGVGDVITYAFRVTNTGDVTLHALAISDQLVAPAGPAVTVTCPATTLAPAASITCTATPYTVTQADVDAGSVANTATATGTTPGGTPVTSTPSSTTTPTPAGSALTLVKTATLSTDSNNDGKAGVGDVISFAFRVTNTGDVTLHGLAISDQLVVPAGPAVTITCPTTTLAPGATTTCTSSPYTVTQADVDAGSVANTATSTALTPGGTPVTSTPSSTTTPTPGAGTLTLVKTATLTTDTNQDGKAGVGDVITYAFQVTNTGDVTLHGLAISDQLVAPAGPAVTITCPTSTLAPGASITCTATGYTVTQADVDAGSVANTATATGTTPGGTPVTSTPSSTTTPTPAGSALTLVKTATLSTDSNNDGKAGVGDVITYAFTVTNTGDVTLHGLAVADQLVAPAGPAVTITCPATTLAPGASITCTSSSYTVTQADVDAGSVANTATATALTPGGTPTPSNPSTVTTPAVAPNPGLVFEKQVSSITDANHDNVTDLGDQIVWRFLTKNTGNVTLNNVRVVDAMLTAVGVQLSCPATTLAPGASSICESDPYTITQADVDARQVANTALSVALPPVGPKVTSRPSKTVTRVDSGPRQPAGPSGPLAFTGASAALLWTGLAGLIAMILGGLLIWAARRDRALTGRRRV